MLLPETVLLVTVSVPKNEAIPPPPPPPGSARCLADLHAVEVGGNIEEEEPTAQSLPGPTGICVAELNTTALFATETVPETVWPDT